MRIGYARVSMIEQDYASQVTALTEKGCEKIYKEKVTGTSTAPRTELANMIENVREGDTVYVTKIDRLARSIHDLNRIVTLLNDKGVSITFMAESMTFEAGEQASSLNRLLFNVLGSFAQFERDLIVERTSEGRARAVAQGKHMGRPASSSEKDIERAIDLMNNRDANGHTVADICALTSVKRATLYAKMKETPKEVAMQ